MFLKVRGCDSLTENRTLESYRMLVVWVCGLWLLGRSGRYGGPRLSFAHRWPAACLVREAPQLKTVATVVRGAGIEKLHTEIQIQTEKAVGSG